MLARLALLAALGHLARTTASPTYFGVDAGAWLYVDDAGLHAGGPVGERTLVKAMAVSAATSRTYIATSRTVASAPPGDDQALVFEPFLTGLVEVVVTGRNFGVPPVPLPDVAVGGRACLSLTRPSSRLLTCVLGASDPVEAADVTVTPANKALAAATGLTLAVAARVLDASASPLITDIAVHDSGLVPTALAVADGLVCFANSMPSGAAVQCAAEDKTHFFTLAVLPAGAGGAVRGMAAADGWL